jgi:hypothetical protein
MMMPRSNRQCRLGLLLILVIWADLSTGCSPQGAGTVVVGNSSQWRKPPAAPSGNPKVKASSKKERDKPAAWKSSKEGLKERLSNDN